MTEKRAWRKYLKTAISLLFLILIPALLYTLVRDMEWQDVKDALTAYSWPVLLAGAGLGALSYILLSSFDLLGRYHTGHGLPVRQVLPIAFVCYTFNLNFGAWLGGIALRYRLYSRAGLELPTITGVLGISLVTNWLGHMILAGVLFTMNTISLPESWGVSQLALRALGIGMLTTALAYFLACQFASHKTWHWRDHEITLPPLKIALLQAVLGISNWCVIAALLYMLLPDTVPFPVILGIFMVSSIAGVITHIPGGLGVIETVFLAILRNEIPSSTILAALLAYRALYYLLYLPMGVALYLFMEKRSKASSA